MLFCIRQEKCVTSAMVAYIEQWFGGLVSETSYCGEWCSVMFHGVSLWFAERTGWLGASGKAETTHLIVLTFSKHLYLRLDSAVAFQRFVYVLTIFSISLCLLSAYLPASRKCPPLCCLAAHLPCDFHVSVCLPFGLSAWLSVSRVYLSVVKTFYWLTVTKWGLKC